MTEQIVYLTNYELFFFIIYFLKKKQIRVFHVLICFGLFNSPWHFSKIRKRASSGVLITVTLPKEYCRKPIFSFLLFVGTIDYKTWSGLFLWQWDVISLKIFVHALLVTGYPLSCTCQYFEVIFDIVCWNCNFEGKNWEEVKKKANFVLKKSHPVPHIILQTLPIEIFLTGKK